MNKYRVVIVEDEKIAAENLEKLILELEPEIRVMAILASISQSVKWLSSNEADLIFMDIQLGDGQSFNIFEKVSIKTPVIFTTAYDQYAIKAFKANGIDYLLKPIDEAELKAALEKYKNLVQKQPDLNLLRELLIQSQHKPEYKQRFMIQAGSRIRTIPVEDIAYFYFVEKAVFICTYDNHRFATEHSLDRLEELTDPDVFFRINRRLLISIKSIEKIYSLSKSRLKLELKPAFEDEVLVSFNKTPAFREWLNK
jgi:two-component system, LytTR family, response regulator LytT